MSSFTIDNLKTFDHYKIGEFDKYIGKLAQVHNGREAVHFIIEKYGNHSTKKYGKGVYVKGPIQTFLCKSGEKYSKGDMFFCRMNHIDIIYENKKDIQ